MSRKARIDRYPMVQYISTLKEAPLDRPRCVPGDLLIEKSGGGDLQPVGRCSAVVSGT